MPILVVDFKHYCFLKGLFVLSYVYGCFCLLVCLCTMCIECSQRPEHSRPGLHALSSPFKPSMAIFQSKVRAGDEAEAEPLICECSAVL